MFRISTFFQTLTTSILFRQGEEKKQYVEVKNLFMRMKIKDSIIVYATNFRKYDIQEGQRPDNVALELYGDGNYDWVVLLTANIINARDE